MVCLVFLYRSGRISLGGTIRSNISKGVNGTSQDQRFRIRLDEFEVVKPDQGDLSSDSGYL